MNFFEAALKITGLNQSKILNETDDVIRYEYEDGEKIQLNCTYTRASENPIPYYMYWTLEEPETNNSYNHGTVDNNMKMLEPEEIRQIDSIDKAGETDKLEDTSNKPGLMKTIVYSVCAIFAAMILIAFIVLMKTACNRNKNINQQQDTKVHCSTATKNCEILTADQAYSNPTDELHAVTDPVSSDYSDPYTALYTTPIPKRIRKNLDKNDNSNTVKKRYYENLKDSKRVNMNESIPYENLNKEYVSKYANIYGKNNEAYCNLNDTDSNLYYSVVEK
ncbi:unnamed protein product [Euphydryas editha]|uniref:Uncharacterized protein n=1 Tax=Euphydryas editha TaxID=104508 RepID=A0AAU9URZ7_EUPED|nr:unnamed protein product [Euphydryas editha]